MEVAFFVVAILGLLALTSGGGGSQLSGRISLQSTGPPQPWTPAPASPVFAPYTPSTGANINPSQFSGVATIGGGDLAKQAGVSASAIPVIGAAIGATLAIATALLAAHKQRLQQATAENTAVNNGVLGWDAGMRQVNQAYNSRQIDPQTAIKFIGQIMAYYWAEVVPHIQPGRNGCNNGNSCPGSAQPNSSTGYATTAPSNYCSGDIGAACCVGCADLQLSASNAIVAIQRGGGQSFVQAVYPSKYGAVARAAYTLTWN